MNLWIIQAMEQKNKKIFLISLLLDILFFTFVWNYKFLENEILIESFKLLLIPMLLYIFSKELIVKESEKLPYIKSYNLFSSILISILSPYLLFNEINFSNVLLFSLPFFTILGYLFFKKIKGSPVSFMLNTISLFEARKKNTFNILDILYSFFICLALVLWVIFGYFPAMR